MLSIAPQRCNEMRLSHLASVRRIDEAFPSTRLSVQWIDEAFPSTRLSLQWLDEAFPSMLSDSPWWRAKKPNSASKKTTSHIYTHPPRESQGTPEQGPRGPQGAQPQGPQGPPRADPDPQGPPGPYTDNLLGENLLGVTFLYWKKDMTVAVFGSSLARLSHQTAFYSFEVFPLLVGSAP